MALTAPTVSELATFTGRAESTFTTFASQALAQAALLFTIVTKLDAYPDEDDYEQLARNAILEMADRIYLEQPHATTYASPFASETIGSYSYTKTSIVQRAREGLDTGLFWWELAVDELAQIDRSLVTSGSVSGLDRDLYVNADTGDKVVISPGELEPSGFPFYVNAENSPRDPLG